MYLVLCHPSDILDLSAEQLQYIPKVILLRVYGDYNYYVWNKLPEHVKAYSEVRSRDSALSERDAAAAVWTAMKTKIKIGVGMKPKKKTTRKKTVKKQIIPTAKRGGMLPFLPMLAELTLYVIFPLQTGRKNVMSQNGSIFDNCNLGIVKLYLISTFFPYDDLRGDVHLGAGKKCVYLPLNLDFDKKRYSVLFDMYARFRRAYYGIDCFETLFNVLSFTQEAPFVVIDCSRQNESVKSATVDVRIEFDCKENVPANTTAYCLIIHDRVAQYNPLTNVMRKIM
ncbi:hypothetical protein ALC57_11065 [Trachymyrmex cornetzi]|uniref:Double jelly roll-like domain-containing protein n=1 Tax=Trachymyrmex cornetzi TaxID=471704 RepID=A0A151J2X9_9HYME|nr:hypothetical protein ALC57_11065 [Trachymyrmex cornetzi]